jgi:hypothetical protein
LALLPMGVPIGGRDLGTFPVAGRGTGCWVAGTGRWLTFFTAVLRFVY